MLGSRLSVAASSAAVGLLIASAAAANAATPTRHSVTPPDRIAKAGKIVYCSDIAHSRTASYRGWTPVGADVDIGTAIAQLMGVKAGFRDTAAEGIVPALLSGKCDAILSAMSDT